jgi:hypothetical protein
MNHYVIGGIAIVLAVASMPTAAEAVTVNCNTPAHTISGALALGAKDITVVGTCTENVEIRQDDVTIEGIGAATVVGQLFVNGANRVTVKNLTVQGAPQPADSGILIDRGGSAVLDHVTVRNAVTGVDATGSSYVEIINGSLFENNTADGIRVQLGSSGVVKDSTSRNNGDGGVTVTRGGSVELVHNSFVDNVGFQVFITEGSTGFLEGNTLTAAGEDEGLGVFRNATARLRGDNTITAQAGALDIQRTGVFIQAFGHDVVNGPIAMFTLGNVDIRDAVINGDVNIDDHSVVTLRSDSTTVNGNIGLARDSGLSLEGPVIINGSIDCADDESSFFSTEGLPANCTGF